MDNTLVKSSAVYQNGDVMPADSKNNRPFWETHSIDELSPGQWEALCDRCALCCTHKIEDADSGVVYYLDKPCRLLDPVTRQCRHYAGRQRHVPDCATLTPENVRQFDWLPETCAYRRLALGKPLPSTHPLLHEPAGCRAGHPRRTAEGG
jgi:uncharacterized protein